MDSEKWLGSDSLLIFIKAISVLYLIVFILIACVKLLYYRNLYKHYGQKNASKIFYKNFGSKILCPDKKSKKYRNLQKLFLNIDWKLNVEQFYIYRYCIVFIILLIGLLVNQTNINIQNDLIINDVNYKRSIMDNSVMLSDELKDKERKLFYETQGYLINNNIPLKSENLSEIIDEFIKSKKIDYDTIEAVSKRIYLKIIALSNRTNNLSKYTLILFFAYIGFNLPKILAKLKLILVNNKKDWDTLNCMTVYSLTARLPPYKIASVIENIISITQIYKNLFTDFQVFLQNNEKENMEQLLNNVSDDNASEILETLTLANELGVNETVQNIDDLQENAVKWLEISADKKRQIKSIISIVAVFIVMFLLFEYLMFNLNSINQLSSLGI